MDIWKKNNVKKIFFSESRYIINTDYSTFLPTEFDGLPQALCAIISPGGENMTKEYITLFNAVSEALEALEAVQMKLMAAQYNAEEDYIGRKN